MIAPWAVLVTDVRVVPEAALVARIRAAAMLPAELRARLAVQLRDPELPARSLLALGRLLRDETRALGASLLVNDRLDLAVLLDADGVHLGRRSVRVAEARALLARTSSRTGATGREPFVSVACHAPSDVVAAAREGADAAVLSPIFASPGKGAPLGPAALAEARRALDDAGFSHVHLVALGGIDASRAPSCFAAGAGGVAAIRESVVSTLATRLAT